jgi:hypothetical protein
MPEFVFDSFTRTDSSSSLGSADVGGVWTASHGTWGISSNQAYTSASDTGGTFGGLATIDHGWSDGSIQVNVTNPSNGHQGGLNFRYSDANNFWVAFIYRANGSPFHSLLYAGKAVAGSVSYLINGVDVESVITYPATLSVTTTGSSIGIYLNGSQVSGSPLTDSHNSTATGHGLHLFGTTTLRLDAYLAQSLARIGRVTG